MRTSAFVAPEVDCLDERGIRKHSEIASALAVQPRRCAVRQCQLRRHRPFRRLDHVRERRVRQKQNCIHRKRRLARIGNPSDFGDEAAAFWRNADFKLNHCNTRVALYRENPAPINDAPANAGNVLCPVRRDFVSAACLRIERALCLDHRRKSAVFLCVEDDLLNGRASADASAEFKPRRVLHAIRAIRKGERRRRL